MFILSVCLFKLFCLLQIRLKILFNVIMRSENVTIFPYFFFNERFSFKLAFGRVITTLLNFIPLKYPSNKLG
jgi:hypothetical protein